MTRDVPDSCVSSSRYPWSSVYRYILGAQTIPVGIINPSSALGGLRLCTIHSHLMSPCLAHRKHLVRMWCGRCAEGKPLMASLLGIVFAASFKASLGAELETWIYTFHTIRKRQQCVTEHEKPMLWQYSIPSRPFWMESFIHFWSCHAACQILTLQFGGEPIPLAVEDRVLNTGQPGNPQVFKENISASKRCLSPKVMHGEALKTGLGFCLFPAFSYFLGDPSSFNHICQKVQEDIIQETRMQWPYFFSLK